MGQFEKWWKKERRVDTLAGYRNDEDIWRAALEEVLKQIEIGNKIESSAADILIAVEDWIKKEFGEML